MVKPNEHQGGGQDKIQAAINEMKMWVLFETFRDKSVVHCGNAEKVKCGCPTCSIVDKVETMLAFVYTAGCSATAGNPQVLLKLLNCAEECAPLLGGDSGEKPKPDLGGEG